MSTYRSFPIFSVLSEEECECLEKMPEVSQLTLHAGDEASERAVYLVNSGSLSVYSGDSSHPVLLRNLQKGDIFGVAILFSKNEKFSRITAREKTKLTVLPESVILKLMDMSSDFRKEYLTYLCDRISFLNKRISGVTAGSAEKKLLSWLCSSGSEVVHLTISLSDLARSLDMGRASLYRAFDSLEKQGMIQRDGDIVTILCDQDEL